MSNDTTIDAQLLDLMLRAGSRWVLWLMLGLSLAAIAVIFERVWFFIQERPPRRVIALALRTLTDKGPAAALAKLAGVRSMEAAVARACLTHAADGPAAVEEHKAASLEEERLRHERRIAFLGTLGNNRTGHRIKRHVRRNCASHVVGCWRHLHANKTFFSG